MVAPLYNPAPETVAQTNIEQFRQLTGASDFDALYQWSITQRESFWSTLWDFTGVIGEKGATVATSPNTMPGTRWFPEARLNYAENLLRNPTGDAAIIAIDERGQLETITRAELTRRAARFATYLTDCGIAPGDRVAGIVGNRIDTTAAMLGTTWIGAVWSSCSPDFGTQAIIDRFSQIEPRVLVGCTGYSYNGKWFEVTEKLASVKASLPSVKYSIALSNEPMQGWHRVDETDGDHGTIPDFVRLPFDAPLYIMFSSGTTGVPKCIVHGIGGSLLQHLKEHQLHSDVSAGDRLFFFTTCGWMMWNWLVSGLASQAVLCLYDGSPFHPDPGSLSRFVEAAQINHFGISPGYISALAKADYAPNDHHDLSSLTGILSTGSPLPAESFDWAYEHIAPVRLSSITGGTDIMGCFALGHPGKPVYRGEIQAPGLGMATDFFDDAGKSVPAGAADGKGELVCTRSFPSMPTGFWNDPDGARYRAAYFERFPGVWHHGDFGEFTPRGGVIIHGRSDAVLNRGGVRIGTAEIYRQVETVAEVLESIAIAQQWQDDVRIVLFVRLREDASLDEELRQRIRTAVRAGASPRHVPDVIIEVADIPRTRSGKLVELAVRDVVHGRKVKNQGALANPEALGLFRDLPELAG
jgi:acetoacetyl-CoA synthetase